MPHAAAAQCDAGRIPAAIALRCGAPGAMG
jgi:hypothetical protein